MRRSCLTILTPGFPAAMTPLLSSRWLNHRMFEFTVQAMEDGGMVVLVDNITEQRMAEAKINHLARFDALTGLPNRATLQGAEIAPQVWCGAAG
jgi:predicted signal transduction protein with EAL and GGDEF domain